MLSFFSKMNDRIKLYGIKTLVSRGVKKVGSRLGIRKEVYLYCRYDLDSTPQDRKLAEGFAVRQVTMDDFLYNSAIHFSPEKLDIFRKRLTAGGFYAYGIFYQEKLVAFAWSSTS